MGLLTNSAFSRSWLIRISESYSHKDLPFAMELVEEKVVCAIRSSKCLRMEGVRFTLDSIHHKDHHSKVHASHILGSGLTVQLIKKSEYETAVNVIICNLRLERLKNLELQFLAELKEQFYMPH